MIGKTLIGMIVGLSLTTGVAMAQKTSEKFILPERFQNFTIYNQGIMNVWIAGEKYHAHVFDIDGNKMADMGLFYPFGAEKNLEDHHEALYHAFDLNGNNSFQLDELFVRKVNPKGEVEWYSAEIKPKQKFA